VKLQRVLRRGGSRLPSDVGFNTSRTPRLLDSLPGGAGLAEQLTTCPPKRGGGLDSRSASTFRRPVWISAQPNATRVLSVRDSSDDFPNG